jgi:hypothetical protein
MLMPTMRFVIALGKEFGVTSRKIPVANGRRTVRRIRLSSGVTRSSEKRVQPGRFHLGIQQDQQARWPSVICQNHLLAPMSTCGTDDHRGTTTAPHPMKKKRSGGSVLAFDVILEDRERSSCADRRLTMTSRKYTFRRSGLMSAIMPLGQPVHP